MAQRVSSFHDSVSLLNLCLCTSCSLAGHRGTHNMFPLPYPGSCHQANRSPEAGSKNRPQEDRKPCPTKSNFIVAHFQNKSSHKGFAEPASPTQHHGTGPGTPAAHARKTLGGGRPQHNPPCAEWLRAGERQVLLKALF